MSVAEMAKSLMRNESKRLTLGLVTFCQIPKIRKQKKIISFETKNPFFLLDNNLGKS